MSNVETEKLYESDVVNQNIMYAVRSSDVGNSLASTCSGKLEFIKSKNFLSHSKFFIVLGDSGSPVFATINGQSVVIGIVSFGARNCHKGRTWIVIILFSCMWHLDLDF